MAYKEKEFCVAEMKRKVENDRLDMEAIEKARQNRLRLLSFLPDYLMIRSLQVPGLYNEEATIHMQLDGDVEHVTCSMLYLLNKLPPIPVENITDSCRWFQPAGYRGGRTRWDSEHLRILPVCPVWVETSHVVKSSMTYMKFNWYTTLSRMSKVVGECGEDATFKASVEILQPQDYVRYRYTCGHSHGANDITVGSQKVQYRFMDPETWIVGSGSRSNTRGVYFYWDHNKDPVSVFLLEEKWVTKKTGGS